MAVRCDTCGGRKKILGMGGMMKSCTDCNETGFKKEDTNVVMDALGIDKRSKAYRELKKKGA